MTFSMGVEAGSHERKVAETDAEKQCLMFSAASTLPAKF